MGTNIPKNNRNLEIAADQNLIDGFNKHAALIQALLINGAPQTPQQIVGTLNSRIDSAKAVVTTRATWKTAIATDETVQDTTKTYVASVRQNLVTAFAGQTDVLTDFGLTARAKPVVTPEERVARTAKAKATRAARHTMGSKQKAAIKGTVTPTAPATTAPPAATPIPAAPPASPAPQATTSPTAPPATPVPPAGDVRTT
ncbi:MAG TPA: hypothetical protein VHV30_07070 [Polyangiaceae bacterium]|nr:hypothetical protein [Polyangiaceae bacterium]